MTLRRGAMDFGLKSRLALILTFCMSVTTAAPGQRLPSNEQEQVEFVTAFYRHYLAQPWRDRARHSNSGAFYSRGANELIAQNLTLCRTLSRGDDICGYGADGDVFLSSQETDPQLNFKKARFHAVPSGPHTVDVAFNVYPKYGKDYDRKLRYILVEESSGWRVDDVYFADENGFADNQSLRHQINEENARVLAQASDILDAVKWVSVYLSDRDMLARAERFVDSKVEICSQAGACKLVAKGKDAATLRRTMGTLYKAYRIDESGTINELGRFVPKNVSAVEGRTVQVDAFDFTFHDKTWWITRIDLRRLHGAASLRRQRAAE